eukprot:7734594-Lingulodinium_polyedra.AAC.1
MATCPLPAAVVLGPSWVVSVRLAKNEVLLILDVAPLPNRKKQATTTSKASRAWTVMAPFLLLAR